MNKRVAAVALGVALIAGSITSCGSQRAGARGLVVVTTTAILAALVRPVLGDRGSVVSLIPAGDDPHGYQPSARDRRRVADADLLVINGGGLEEGLTSMTDQAAHDGVATEVALRAVDALRYTNGDLDPHFWQDPNQSAAVVAAVGQRLRRLDPSHAGAYRQAALAFEARLSRLAKEAKAVYASLPERRRVLVSNHDAYRYLAHRFGFEVLGSIVPGRSTAAAPSPRHLADLAAAMRRQGVCAVFTEEGGSTDLAIALAHEVGPRVAVVPLFAGVLPRGGYPALVRDNAERIVHALEHCR